MRIGVSCTCLLVLFSGVALAQSAALATKKPPSFDERLLYASTERMQWEAAQTWNQPLIPKAANEAEHRPIHLEQPVLTPPRIRREWLLPAPKVTASDASADEVSNFGGSAYSSKKAQ